MKNDVTFEGKVVSEPQFSHKSGKNVYYSFLLSCKRKSGVEDIIPVRMLKKNAEKLPITIGNYIRVRGRFQSYNSQEPENFGKRLVYINALDAELCKKKNIKNDITLEGIVLRLEVGIHGICAVAVELDTFGLAEGLYQQTGTE